MNAPLPADCPTPALVVDRAVLERNIAGMAGRMRRLGVQLRPHWKTSKMVEVARLQEAGGCVGFTCATPAEVQCLLDHGYTDLTWAHQPVGDPKVAAAVEANRRGRVRVALDSVEAAGPLAAAARQAGVVIPYLVEVDTGLGRAGVSPDRVVDLAGRLADLDGLRLEGVMTHEGHLSGYGEDREGLQQEGRSVGRTIAAVAKRLRDTGFTATVVSVGSTPGSTSTPTVPGITEARAGTYVFNDANQVTVGSAPLPACALTVAARVVSTPRPGEAIIDAGSKSMSSDPPTRGAGFGRLLAPDGASYAEIDFPPGQRGARLPKRTRRKTFSSGRHGPHPPQPRLRHRQHVAPGAGDRKARRHGGVEYQSPPLSGSRIGLASLHGSNCLHWVLSLESFWTLGCARRAPEEPP